MEYLVITVIIIVVSTGYILSIKNNRPTLEKLAVIC